MEFLDKILWNSRKKIEFLRKAQKNSEFLGNCQKKIPGSFMESSKKIPGSFMGFLNKIPRIFREFPKKIPGFSWNSKKLFVKKSKKNFWRNL